MRAQFLEKLVKTFPNDYELGQAIRKYHLLRSNGNTKPDCEEIVLSSTFNNN